MVAFMHTGTRLTAGYRYTTLGDATKFIEKCLTGVKFPRQWWWALIYIKCVAISGLIVGLAYPGVRVAALAGIVTYFFAAAFAHLKAKFTGTEFWANCLGMLILSIAALIVTLAA